MSNLRDVLGSMFDRESRADPSPTPQAAPSDPTPPFTAQDELAWCREGRRLADLGRIGDAMTCYNKAVALDPGYVNAWFNKATAEEQAGRPRDAASSYERFLNVAPAGDVVRIQRARLRLRELKG